MILINHDVGVIHLMIVQTGFHLQTYLGILFSIDIVAAFASALWIALQDAPLSWLLGGVAAFVPFVSYIVTRNVGFPGIHRLPWQAPNGLLSLVIEAIVVVLTISALAQQSRTRTTMRA